MARKDETAEIVLGEEKHTIYAPTLDQLQEMLPLVDAMGRAPTVVDKVKACRALVAQAIGKKPEELGALHITPLELLDAADAIMKVTGLEEVKKRFATGKV